MWTKFLDRPGLIESLYATTPSLSQFRLSEVTWNDDRGACMLRGSLAQYADYPRQGWEEDANRLGIRLWLEEIEEFEIQGWSFENIVDMEISQIDGSSRLSVSAEGEDMRFRFVCTTLVVGNIYAYRSVEAEIQN